MNMRKTREIATPADAECRDTLTGWEFAPGHDSPLRALKAIRAKCIECCCGQVAEVARCHISDCPLWPYRAGRNPARAGKGGDGTALRVWRESQKATARESD